ncbi:ATP-binding protein [Amycolatopsis lurida]
MVPDQNRPATLGGGADKFDDEHYPAYTMGRAADMLGTSQNFLRSLDEAGLIEPQRSAGGHRRYSRYQLRIAARVRELVDQGRWGVFGDDVVAAAMIDRLVHHAEVISMKGDSYRLKDRDLGRLPAAKTND